MENIQQYLQYSPLENAIVGRDETGQMDIYIRFVTLSDAFRKFLVAPETAQVIADWEQSGFFPPNFRTAVAKTIMLSALGDVKLDSLPTLLERIGLPRPQSTVLAKSIGEFIGPYLETTPIEIPEVVLDPEAGETTELLEIPPLTSAAPPEPGVATSQPTTSSDAQPVSNQASRNIIDLRKTP
jgi:hypothetical protein